MADKLGQPFMPWQRYVADVGGEINPETGLPAYREVVVTVPRQSGKSLDATTPLLTANRGWVTMGAVEVGDEVFHPGGHRVTVVYVSPVWTGHDCYRVTTVDGRSVVADADHLWAVTDKRAERSRGSRGSRVRHFEQRTLTTRAMFESGLSRYASGGRTSRTAGKAYTTNEYRYVLPTQEPLKLDDAELPVDPYLLGGWLGDGDSGSGRLTCHVSEVDHWSAAITAAGFTPTCRQGGGTLDTWSVSITSVRGRGRNSRTFAAMLRRLGLVNNKHVPDSYLTSGAAQREALLQGLLDTDGFVDATRGQVEFCSTSQRLAEDVLFLARSLGWRATLTTGRASLDGRDCGPKYRVTFTPKRSDPFTAFRLERKLARVRDRDGGKGRATLSVASITPVESVPVRCIKVDSPDGLFLAGRGLIPTHNTTLFLAWQINRCLSRRWRHPQRSVFTAQTGKDARDKWLDELYPLIRNSALRALVSFKNGRYEINEGMGNEFIKFKTGSLIRLLSTSTSSGHSKSLHQAVLDEIWHDVDDRREQGLRPAMITVDDAQLLVCSTAGTDESLVLNRKVTRGRAATVDDVGTGVAYFEWSAPDGWNPEDEDSYYSFMPALCPHPPCRCAPYGQSWRHTVTSLNALRDERNAMKDNNYAEFRRAYGNRKTSAADERWRVLSQADWLAAEDPTTPGKQGLVLALHASPESTHAAVCAAWRGERGVVLDSGQSVDLIHIAVFDHQPGLGWTVGRVVELAAKWKAARVVLDPACPAGSKVPELTEALKPLGVELVPMKVRDVCVAFGMLRNGIASEPDPELEPIEDPDSPAPAVANWRLKVRPHPALAAAVEVANTRYVGASKAWEWRTPTDQSSLLAATNAVWGLMSMAEPEPAPKLWAFYG